MFTIDTFNLGSPLGEKSGLAGLDSARAYVVAEYYECKIGNTAVFDDPSTPQHTQLTEALESGMRSRESYRRIGDIERAAKAAALVVRLCNYLGRRRQMEAAIADLEGLRRQAIRDLGELAGMSHR